MLLPIRVTDGKVEVLDQTKLPFEVEYYQVYSSDDIASAIKEMKLRGSGALGLAGAYGVFMASRSAGSVAEVRALGEQLKATRPTAVNLHKTVDRMVNGLSTDFRSEVESRLVEVIREQLGFEEKLGEAGAELIKPGDNIMTHCHSGAVAGAGYGGRALSVIRKAHEQGKRIHVFVNETRPYLQGARITAWELKRFGIPFTLITDNMSGFFMEKGKVNLVVVGSDRVARNGDLANKIGTYLHALAAKDNGVPFYTATSSHTIDLGCPSGNDIPVEMRDPNEVLQIAGHPIAEPGTQALYPGFDITPARLIAGIVTERGVIRPPYEVNLRLVFGDSAH